MIKAYLSTEVIPGLFHKATGMRRPMMYAETTASGHLALNWPNAGHSFYTRLCWWLWLRHGLVRSGRAVVSPDDVILPDFGTGGLRVRAGWDNWSGVYLLSEDAAGDTFLKRLARAEPARRDRHA